MAQDRVEKWVRRVLTDPMLLRTDDVTPRKPLMLSLMHVTSGIKSEVYTLKIGSKQYDPKVLADMFNGTADEHSSGLSSSESGSGQEAYQLTVFYDDMPDLPQCPLPLMRRTGPMALADDPIVTEPPTPKGELAQSMRERAGWMQFTLEMVARTYSAQIETIASQGRELATLRKENQETIEIAKEMILEKAADTHAHRMQELDFERKSEERKRLMAAAPPLINQLLGREVFPASHVDSTLVDGLMADLDTDTMQKLTEVLLPKLKPETAALLLGRFNQVVEEQNRKKALAVRENANGTNGVKS